MLTDSKRVGLAMEMACEELSGNGTQGSDDAKHPFPCARNLLYTTQSRDKPKPPRPGRLLDSIPDRFQPAE